MLLLTGITVDSSYVAHVLPGLLLMGVGLGLIFAPAMNTRRSASNLDDAGVASATVNTGQQVGGSVGTALLSSLSASAATAFVGAQHATPQLLSEAAVHGYTTAFGWSAGIFVLGALACGLLLPYRVAEVDPDAEPVFSH